MHGLPKYPPLYFNTSHFQGRTYPKFGRETGANAHMEIFGMTVYLGEFRKAIRGFLDEWAGEHSPTQLLAKCANLWR